MRTCKFLIFLIVVAVLTTAAPARAQFGLGPVPVVDVEANPIHWPLQLARMVAEIELLQKQLDDMLIQAGIGTVPWNDETDVLLRQMGQYGLQGPGLLYGGNLAAKWLKVFTGATTWADGRWLAAAITRSEDALATQQKLAHLVAVRHASFAQDNARILALQQAVDGARGRNQLIKAQAALDAEKIRQQQMTQQVDMTLANMQAVSNAYQINEQMAREAQERAFLTNFDREPPPVVYVDRGL